MGCATGLLKVVKVSTEQYRYESNVKVLTSSSDTPLPPSDSLSEGTIAGVLGADLAFDFEVAAVDLLGFDAVLAFLRVGPFSWSFSLSTVRFL